MNFRINLTPDAVKENAALLSELFSDDWVEAVQSPSIVGTTINYNLKWSDGLPQIAKRASILRALTEKGVLETVNPDRTEEALYYIDCIKEEFEKIRKRQ